MDFLMQWDSIDSGRSELRSVGHWLRTSLVLESVSSPYSPT